MPIIAKAGGGVRELVPVGNHVALCISVIEVGTIEREFKGDKRKTHEVRLGFEFPDLTVDVDGVMKPKTLYVFRNLSLAPNSRLGPELESWRGRPFTAEEKKGFDIEKLLGVPAMINIIHSEDGNYDNIGSISPLPKSVAAPTPQHPLTKLSYDNWDQQVFQGLPDFLRLLIEETPEFKGKFGGKLPGEGRAGGPPGSDPRAVVTHYEAGGGDPLPDEPPF